MYELPTTVLVDSVEYNIRNKADYRVILDIIKICQDESITEQEQAVAAMFVFYDDVNQYDDVIAKFKEPQNAIKVMMDFINMYDTYAGYTSNLKLMDWELDEKLIASSINGVIHRDIRQESYCHWWTFLSYFMAIQESVLSTVVGIRHKIKTGKKLEKYERDFRNQNPQYFSNMNKTAGDLEFDNQLRELWANKGG